MLDVIIFAAGLFIVRSGLVIILQRLARSQFASRTRIYRLPITEEQRSRERGWQQGIFIDSLVIILLSWMVGVSYRSSTIRGFSLMAVSHVFVVEFIYYWYHRALHTPYLYRNHHIRHHLSTVTEPVTAITFTFSERLSYTFLFTVPAFITNCFGMLSFLELGAYLLVFDFLNYTGHFNFEFLPKWFLRTPLKWLVYSPSYHSQHHSKILKNYALFMPIYDLFFGTLEPDTDKVFYQSIEGKGLKSLTEKPISITT